LASSFTTAPRNRWIDPATGKPTPEFFLYATQIDTLQTQIEQLLSLVVTTGSVPEDQSGAIQSLQALVYAGLWPLL
jgi:hypothetical protein